MSKKKFISNKIGPPYGYDPKPKERKMPQVFCDCGRQLTQSDVFYGRIKCLPCYLKSKQDGILRTPTE